MFTHGLVLVDGLCLCQHVFHVVFANFERMVRIHGLTLFKEVVKDVIGYCYKPLKVVYRRCCVPPIREEQVFEVEKYDLTFFIEISIKALNGVHSAVFHLPGIDL